jgi:hypothetical protein
VIYCQVQQTEEERAGGIYCRVPSVSEKDTQLAAFTAANETSYGTFEEVQSSISINGSTTDSEKAQNE